MISKNNNIESIQACQSLHIRYPTNSPYSPGIKYPEYTFNDLSQAENQIYEQVRKLLIQSKLDHLKYGRQNWNPLGEIINPGDQVLIKPNWVYHGHNNEYNFDSLVTHSSIIRAILDYIIIALQGDGIIFIGDAPIQSCQFDILVQKTRIKEVTDFLSSQTSIPIHIVDFRNQLFIDSIKNVNRSTKIAENAYRAIDLKQDSFLNPISYQYDKFRITNYDHRKMKEYHDDNKNIYLIAKTVLESNVIIEIPKLKCHRKAGITCCLKNNVGINVKKDSLVHHLKGAKSQSGDAYLHYNIFKAIRENLEDKYNEEMPIAPHLLIKFLLKILRFLIVTTQIDDYYEGSWIGNDTIWRMILDLTNIVYYADKNGIMNTIPQRKLLYLVDGVICGEGEGPLHQENIQTGLLVLGQNPILVDIACSKWIGFDYKKIPLLTNALQNQVLDTSFPELEDMIINVNNQLQSLKDISPIAYFKPPSGWKGAIELLHS